jgi:hypothetical protein
MAACVAPAGAEGPDVDPDDSPEAPWPQTRGEVPDAIDFANLVVFTDKPTVWSTRSGRTGSTVSRLGSHACGSRRSGGRIAGALSAAHRNRGLSVQGTRPFRLHKASAFGTNTSSRYQAADPGVNCIVNDSADLHDLSLRFAGPVALSMETQCSTGTTTRLWPGCSITEVISARSA